MRKILLTAFVLIPLLTSAQFKKGDKFLGGTLSINFQNAPDSPNGDLTNKSNSFSINPSIGFLLNENFAIGGQIGYSSSYQKMTNYSPYIIEFKSKSFSTGIFAQRYFNISDNFLFSIIGLVNYSRGQNNNEQINTTTNEVIKYKTDNYQLSTSFRPNFIFFPSPKWGLEASIGSISYLFSKNISADKKQNFFNVNYGTITLGLSYYFR